MSVVDVASALAVGVAQTVLKPVRPDPGPATGRWGVGVGEFAAGRMPGVMRGLARQLNRFGSVVVSPAFIEFDGDEVPWSQVTEIKTRRLVGYLLTDAVAQGVNRLPIWRFPGRGLVLTGLSHTALTAVAVAADLRLDRGVFTLYLPAEVQSKGLIRRKQMSPGLPAALVLADPAVRDLIESTAQAHGIPVRQADNDALELAAQRAAVIRSAVGRVAAVAAALTGQDGTRSSA